MSKRKPSTDLYPSSLLLEAHKVLGEEFSRLPKRIQIGYATTFWNHSNIIKHNKHNRKPDSFAMGEKEVSRNFTDPRDFRKVNDNGYSLRPKRTRHGSIESKNILCKERTGGATTYPPTKWLKKTVDAFKGWSEVGLIGSRNGYQLTPKIQELVDDWFKKPIEEISESIGMVNRDGVSALEIASYYGGAINGDKSRVPKRTNISVIINIDTDSLLIHKEQLNYILSKLDEYGLDSLQIDTNKWHQVLIELNKIEAKTSEAETRRNDEEPLGRVKVNNILSKPLESLATKDFEREGVKQRIFEINRLLATSREQNTATIPVFYDEVRTGRYTAKYAILQGYHRSVRYAALSGCYEYDLEAAHQNILVQLLDREQINFPELDVVRDYINNKVQIRQQLATDLMTSIDTVKQILQALTYGAQLSRNKTQSIYKTCEGDIELVERVISNSWLIKLANTFKIAHKHLVGDAKVIKNAVGIEREIKEKAKAMAHILQGYERLILDVLIANSEPNDVALLVHDCIVYYTPKSTTELTRIVKENTGFELEFSDKQY